jgi:hypothetical protein
LFSSVMLSAEAQKDKNGKPTNNNGPGYQVQPFRARYRVTLNGFTVNHQTNQGLWAAWDAVRFYPNVGMVDASGQLSPSIWDIFTNTIGSSPEHSVQGGTASTRGGLRTGDGFPTQTPWQRTVPYSTGAGGTMPPTVYFEGEIVQNTNASVIIPSIWEIDDRSDLGLSDSYHYQLEHDRAGLGHAVARLIRGPQPLTLNSYLRPGSTMGLGISMRLAVGVTQNRPIGMQPERDQFGFIPQVLVLTFDSADFMSRTDFGSGVGVVPVRYVDPQAFAGDYTLYFQVEKLSG